MTSTGWLQIALFTALVAVTVRPLGGYMKRVFSGEPTALGWALRPIEHGIYRFAGIDPAGEQEWYIYALALLTLNAVGLLEQFFVQCDGTKWGGRRLSRQDREAGGGSHATSLFDGSA